MRFRYDNLYTNKPLMCIIEHNEKELRFELSGLIDKVKKYDLESEEQFSLLNQFFETKSEEFKDEVFELYGNLHLICEMKIDAMILLERFKEKMGDLLNMFSIDEMVTFIHSTTLKPPPGLVEVFDAKLAEDNIGTEEQTFTKGQYLELMGLLLISKIIIGPAGRVYANNASIFNTKAKEYNLVQLCIPEDSTLFYSEQVQKLIKSFTIIVENTMNGFNNTSVGFRNGVPKSDFPIYLLGIVVIKLLPVSIPQRDNINTNAVTFIYSTVRSVLNAKTGYYEKRADLDEETGEPKSIFEMYRMVSHLTPGVIQEIIISMGNIKSNLAIFNIEDSENHMEEIYNNFLKVKRQLIPSEPLIDLAVIILSFTPEREYDKNSIGLLRYEAVPYFNAIHENEHYGSIAKIMITASLVAYYNGHKELALLLSSIENKENNVISNDVGKDHITKERRIKLNEYYKVTPKIDASDTKDHVIIQSINTLCNNIIKKPYLTLSSGKMVEEVNAGSRNLELGSDFRNVVADIIIDLIEKRR